MPWFDFPELAFTQITLIFVSVVWLLRRNDEIPILISTLLFYVSSYRYWSVSIGIQTWIHLSSYGFNIITNESALQALSYIVIGQICLIATYMLRQRRVLPIVVTGTNDPFLLKWLRPKVILVGLLFLPLVVISRSNVSAQVQTGRSLAFEVSGYLRLLPLVLVGIATLLLCLWKLGGLSSLQSKIAAILILIAVSFLTFNVSGRFQFLGWIIAGGIIVSSTYRPQKRLVVLAIIGIIGIAIFTVAGALRNAEFASNGFEQSALDRALSAEDANMLDGFVFVQDVYPQRLDYRWGMEHIEILLRPIPRALWPEKPAGGGYMEAFGLSDRNKGTTVGFSPTLFGSFYADFGIVGIFLFSCLYGWIFGSIILYSSRLQPFASILIRAILCSCLIPLLRGGDLPGIYAWIGMSFWPCFLLLWMKRKNFILRLPSSTRVYSPGNIPNVRHP
ncbi:MAG: oligosaccharide repeat unit polymerase [Aphanothece sp. CMT-3BRIN-NPC111]|jgi:oligosaccharide repeat unit polymerase|nr:oligosaccharide repeat unit polymerase [Aphanothece sp. CMT-3BRIN-NPC111]